MKKVIPAILSFCLFVQITSTAQVIPSSCELEGEIAEYLSQNAARLTIKWLKVIQSPDTALLEIPEEEWGFIREGLYAVYNAETLSGYDTIKTCNTLEPPLNTYIIGCDTNSTWVSAWSKGELLTGDNNMDSLLIAFGFEFVEYNQDPDINEAYVEFYTDMIFNVNVVCLEFLSFSDIFLAITWDDFAYNPNRRLNYHYEDDIRKYTYSYGWMDCPSGCVFWKHWNINVYDDCSVELVGHNPPINTGVSSPDFVSGILTYPNPVTTSTTIEYQLVQPSEVTLAIFNHLGEQVELIRQYQQQGKQQVVWNAVGLPAGMYFFTLKAGEQVVTGKLLKIN